MFRVKYLVGKEPPFPNDEWCYRQGYEQQDFYDLNKAKEFKATLEHTWETEEKFSKDRKTPHVINIKLMELQDTPAGPKWVTLEQSEYDDWFQEHKHEWIQENKILREDEEAILKAISEKVSQIEGARLSWFYSNENMIMIMLDKRESGVAEMVNKLMENLGYKFYTLGVNYITFEKQPEQNNMVQENKKNMKKQIKLKESELRKMIAENIKKVLKEGTFRTPLSYDDMGVVNTYGGNGRQNPSMEKSWLDQARGNNFPAQPQQQPQDMGEEIKPGSVSHGTMRTIDLIPTFMDILQKNAPEKAQAILSEYPQLQQALNDLKAGVEDMPYWDSEEAVEVLNNDIFDAMEELSPEGYYFGSHPGDGSDYGYWEATMGLGENKKSNKIRIKESELRRLIAENVKKTLNEMFGEL